MMITAGICSCVSMALFVQNSLPFDHNSHDPTTTCEYIKSHDIYGVLIGNLVIKNYFNF